MWWLLVPAAVAVGAWLVNRSPPVPVSLPPPDGSHRQCAHPILAHNLKRLRLELSAAPHCPHIFCIGAPGAGKSSLVDALSEEGCEPRPVVGIHTDATDWSRSADAPTVFRWRNMMFIDVPGYGTSHHPTGYLAQHLPIGKADLVLFVVAGTNKIMADDCEMFRRLLADAGDRTVLVCTKMDALWNATPDQFVQAAVGALGVPPSMARHPVSVASGDGLEGLRDTVAVAVTRVRSA